MSRRVRHVAHEVKRLHTKITREDTTLHHPLWPDGTVITQYGDFRGIAAMPRVSPDGQWALLSIYSAMTRDGLLYEMTFESIGPEHARTCAPSPRTSTG